MSEMAIMENHLPEVSSYLDLDPKPLSPSCLLGTRDQVGMSNYLGVIKGLSITRVVVFGDLC